MEFIEEILKEMNNKGISAYQLEEDTKLAHSTISSWKRGTKPTIDKAMTVIKYLGLSADRIFNITPDKDMVRPKEIGNYRNLRFKLQDLQEVETNQIKKKAIQDMLDDIERYSYNE